ncbi:MAG: hypothetical protein ABI557_18360 [Aureliella sp.]
MLLRAYNRLVKRSLDPDGAGPNPATNQYWAYDEGINAVLQFDGAAASNQSHRYLWAEQVDQLLADEQITSPSVAGNTLWGLADIFEVHSHIQVMPLGTADQCHHLGATLPGGDIRNKKPSLPSEGNPSSLIVPPSYCQSGFDHLQRRRSRLTNDCHVATPVAVTNASAGPL